jgi:hypothetical protein
MSLLVLGKPSKAIALMRDLVDGILDGSIQLGDAAGGMTQGLLLFYMGRPQISPIKWHLRWTTCGID